MSKKIDSKKDSLVNGCIGTIIDFVKLETGEIKAVIVALDNPKAGIEQRATYKADCFRFEKQEGVPIYRCTQKYQIRYKKGFKTHGATCQLRQFPLKLAWASTGHKV